MNNLTIDFDPTSELEVEFRTNKWVSVTPDVFRSWTGRRKVKGQLYFGNVYVLLSNEAKPNRALALQTA